MAIDNLDMLEDEKKQKNPLGYDIGKQAGNVLSSLGNKMYNRANRQIDFVTAAPRAVISFSDNVLRGMRSEAPNTEKFKLYPSVEAENILRDKISMAANEPKTEDLYEPPKVNLKNLAFNNNQIPGGGIRNEQTGEVITIGPNVKDSIKVFSSNGKPIEKISVLKNLQSSSGNNNYSFQGSAKDAKAFNSAVSPGEYSPEAVKARELQREQFLERNGYVKPPEAAEGLLKLGDLPGMDKTALKEYNLRLLANRDPKNLLSALEIESQNKLRDIQGKVLQTPPIKESQLKPIVVKEYDELGNVKAEKIKMPNAEGTGYVDDSVPTFTKPKPATTAKLLKMRASKDPNLAAAEAEYKMRFGTLPY